MCAGRQGADAGRPQVRRGVDRQGARHGQRGCRFEGAEFGMGVRRAHEGAMGLAGQRQIGGEGAGSGQEGAVLDAPHRGADQGRGFAGGFGSGFGNFHRTGFKLAARPATVAFLARPPAYPRPAYPRPGILHRGATRLPVDLCAGRGLCRRHEHNRHRRRAAG